MSNVALFIGLCGVLNNISVLMLELTPDTEVSYISTILALSGAYSIFRFNTEVLLEP